MIRVHHGRDGWVADAHALGRVAAVAVVVMALALACCSSKQKNPGEGGNGPGGQLGEGGLGPGGGSSLKGLQTGTTPGGPLSDIHFDYNDSAIRAQDSDILKANADWLNKNPSTRVQIEGHCDDRGSEEYNIALGARRAQAAKDYLSTLGIGADRMSTISYGKELPLCTDETDDCWAQNRRDHFAITQ
jgi:peptidoglycan-associated lipoprotein